MQAGKNGLRPIQPGPCISLKTALLRRPRLASEGAITGGDAIPFHR